MSVRPEMMFYEKAAWVLLLVVFAVLEVRAIDRSDKESMQLRDAQATKFENILLDITGGDAYAYLVPQNLPGSRVLALKIRNGGDRMLTGLIVSFALVLDECAYRDARGDCQTHTDDGFLRFHNVGTIMGGGGREAQFAIDAAPNNAIQSHYTVFLSAQNGTATENIWFRPAIQGTGYAYKYDVRAGVTKTGEDKTAPKDKDYLIVKEVDWQEPRPMFPVPED